MALNHDDQTTLRRYLLKELEEKEQQMVEKRLLIEAGLFEELEISEDELIDEYLAERLSELDRHRFEENFLVTQERYQKVQFSRSLNRYVRANENDERASVLDSPHLWTRHKWALPAFAAVAIVAVVVGMFWLLRPRAPASPTFATVSLTISTSNRVEPAQAAILNFPINVDLLRLQMKLPETADAAASYRVELLRENRERQALPIIGQNEQSVVAEIPAAQLSRGQYALNLYVVKPDGTEQRISGSYFLTVE
jgi:hypothetical protein